MSAKARRAPRETVTVEFDDNALLRGLVGSHDRHLARIEARLDVTLSHRGNRIAIEGPVAARERAAAVLRELYRRLRHGEEAGAALIDEVLARADLGALDAEAAAGRRVIRTPKRLITGRTPVQDDYIAALNSDDLVFGLGPAGTGKTYVAVAAAVHRLIAGEVDRIILSRPAVEAGERLGFLPGDMKDKVDPYLRPLYDALYDMLPGEQVAKRIEAGIIEIAPLAFMRGRTLANAFVILDEAQNATPMQMKMFLTRLGENARMVVTGDMTQTDLPRGSESGLGEAVEILEGLEGVSVVRFSDADVIRHPLVTRIVRAYTAREAAKAAASTPRRTPPSADRI